MFILLFFNCHMEFANNYYGPDSYRNMTSTMAHFIFFLIYSEMIFVEFNIDYTSGGCQHSLFVCMVRLSLRTNIFSLTEAKAGEEVFSLKNIL